MKPKRFFLHVGYAKAGSSLMGEWLAQNPAFSFSDFSIGGLNNTTDLMNIALQDVAAQPQYYVIRDMIFTIPRYDDGDFSKVDLLKEYQKKVCVLLSSLFPTAKVLIVTRGYKSIISANYSQHLKEGGVVKADHIIQYSSIIQKLFDYSFLISLYVKAFGKENVIVLPYELLKENSSVFFRKLETELDLPHFDFTTDVVNPSLDSIEAKYFLKINTVVDFVARNTGSQGRKLKEWYIMKRRIQAFENISGQNIQPKKGAEPLINIPDDILLNLQKNSSLLKEYPVFEKYLSYY